MRAIPSGCDTTPMPTRSRRTAAIATLLVSTLALSLAAAGDATLPGDVRLARWLQAHPIPLAAPLTAFTNLYLSGLPLALAAIALALALLAARRRDAALLIALATAIRATNGLLKPLFDSPRPAPGLVTVTEHATGLGFPSGHAMGATVVIGALAYLLARPTFPPLRRHGSRPTFSPLPGGEGPGVRAWARASKSTASHRTVALLVLRRAAAIVCLALILLTGYGRILVGAHWPSDVLGGYLWGALLLLLAIRFSWAVAGRSTPGPGPLDRG